MALAFASAAGAVTSRITDYILAARWADLPDNVRRETLRSFVNILGCTIGGARHEVVELADSALTEFAGRTPCHSDRAWTQGRCAARLPDQLPQLQYILV